MSRTHIDPAALNPGDAFTVLQFGGPLAELILWAHTGDGDLLVTWATRGTNGFDLDEGPHPSSEPFLLSVGHRVDINTGKGHLIHYAGENNPMGMVIDRTGSYVARDETVNSLTIMAAGYLTRVEELARFPREPEALLDSAKVAELVGVDPATIRRYKAADPTFPPPDVVLGNAPGWYRKTIERWQGLRPGRGAGGGRPTKTSSDPGRTAARTPQEG